MKKVFKNPGKLKRVEDYVTGYLKDNLPEWIRYHSIDHTYEVVDTCYEIGNELNVNDSDLEILITAAWFHDIGYTVKAEEHENISMEITKDYLLENNYSDLEIKKILELISATNITKLPETILEKIICDADLITLGKKDYIEKNNLLREEIELIENTGIDEEFWIKRSIVFMESYEFFTDYVKSKYSKQKEENLNRLRMELEKYH